MTSKLFTLKKEKRKSLAKTAFTDLLTRAKEGKSCRLVEIKQWQ